MIKIEDTMQKEGRRQKTKVGLMPNRRSCFHVPLALTVDIAA